jgi:hypothetical protein
LCVVPLIYSSSTNSAGRILIDGSEFPKTNASF